MESEPTFGDGRYIVRRELGRGTMGVVYEAEDPVLARTVAVKTIDLLFAPGAKARADFERRFFTEARVAARLAHPGIVVCHDVGKDAASGQLFIVFEHLKGSTLEDRASSGAMEWREALAVVIQVARAIHHAHEHGVVHRDLKPANIMLLDPAAGAPPVAKIMDFGVARLEALGPRITKTGQAFGSPLYMSPEQAMGQPSSARSDIFSLGSVLCTLLLGRPWFEAPSLPKIVDRVVHDAAPRPSKLRTGLPAALDDVVARALAKKEGDRYASASEMAEDLEDVLAGRAVKHAVPRGRASEDDGLLAGLTAAPRERRALPAQDPLASLLDEPSVTEAKAGATPPAAATMPIGARATVATDRRREWPVPVVGALIGLAVLAAAAFVWWPRSPAPEPVPPPPSSSVPVVADAAPVPVAEPTSQAAATSTTTLPIEPTATPQPTVAPRPAPTRAVSVVPTTTLAAPPLGAIPESPTAEPAPAEAAATPASEAPGSRIRLAVTHPFEAARLIVWIDGVLVHETKLQAQGSKRIVGFKVREGRGEKMLEVVPGRHEVRVEVTWAEGRTTRTKVVDVADGATGLLEAKVGRMSKELGLTWSRLAKD